MQSVSTHVRDGQQLGINDKTEAKLGEADSNLRR